LIQTTLHVDRKQITSIQTLLRGVKGALPTIQSRAVNKVATAGRAKIVRTIFREVAIKQTDIRKRNVFLRRARKASPVAKVTISGRRVPLRTFQARRTQKGVSYRIRRSGGRKKILHSFLATMRSGHEGVMLRKAGTRMEKKNKEKIVERYGPSVPVVMDGLPRLAAATLDREMAAKLHFEVDRQISVFMRQKGMGFSAGGAA